MQSLKNFSSIGLLLTFLVIVFLYLSMNTSGYKPPHNIPKDTKLALSYKDDVLRKEYPGNPIINSHISSNIYVLATYYGLDEARFFVLPDVNYVKLATLDSELPSTKEIIDSIKIKAKRPVPGARYLRPGLPLIPRKVTVPSSFNTNNVTNALGLSTGANTPVAVPMSPSYENDAYCSTIDINQCTVDPRCRVTKKMTCRGINSLPPSDTMPPGSTMMPSLPIRSTVMPSVPISSASTTSTFMTGVYTPPTVDKCLTYNDNSGNTDVTMCNLQPECKAVADNFMGARLCLSKEFINSRPAGIYRDLTTSSVMPSVPIRSTVMPSVPISSTMMPCASFNDNMGRTNVEGCRAQPNCVPVVPPFSGIQTCYERSNSNLTNPVLKDSFRYL